MKEYTIWKEKDSIKYELLRGHFLKKFRRCPLFCVMEKIRHLLWSQSERSTAMNESKKKDRYEDAKKFVRYSDGAKTR